nr:MAG TPA: hypothetical protein [Caudoviricetes sp.]
MNRGGNWNLPHRKIRHFYSTPKSLFNFSTSARS